MVPYEPTNDDSTDISYLRRDNFKIGKDVAKNINVHGSCVINNFMPTDLADQIATEVLALKSANIFSNVKFVLGSTSIGAQNVCFGGQIAFVRNDLTGCDAIRTFEKKLNALARICSYILGKGKLICGTKVNKGVCSIF